MGFLPNGNSLQMGIGTQWTQSFTIRNADGTLYPVAGNWEFVIRADPAETSSVTPALKVTTTPDANGSITLDTINSVVTVTASPVATGALTQRSYSYSLWLSPGTTTANAWVTGSLFAALIAVP